MTDKTFKRKLHDEIVRAEEREKILALLVDEKLPFGYMNEWTDEAKDMYWSDFDRKKARNEYRAELRQQIKEMR